MIDTIEPRDGRKARVMPEMKPNGASTALEPCGRPSTSPARPTACRASSVAQSYSTPLGRPVDPDVNSTIARSSGRTGCGGTVSPAAVGTGIAAQVPGSRRACSGRVTTATVGPPMRTMSSARAAGGVAASMGENGTPARTAAWMAMSDSTSRPTRTGTNTSSSAAPVRSAPVRAASRRAESARAASRRAASAASRASSRRAASVAARASSSA